MPRVWTEAQKAEARVRALAKWADKKSNGATQPTETQEIPKRRYKGKPITIRQTNNPPPSVEHNWRNMPLEAAIQNLDRLQKEATLAAGIVTERIHRERGRPTIYCIICKQPIPDGRWNFKDDSHRNAQGVLEPACTDSPKCYEVYIRRRQEEKTKSLR